MIDKFFTADSHFGHTNMITNKLRPFSSVDEMDEVMIERWNSKVGMKDIVYHLGDFKWAGRKISEILPKLNGRVILLKGNHDYRLKKWELELFHEVHDILYLKHENIFLCHYAMLTWHKMGYGSIHLHGHSHGSLRRRKQTLDVGVDTNNFYPYNLDEVRSLVKV